MPSVATAVPHYLTGLTLSGGINTAYTAPSGTAVLVQTIIISTNVSSTSFAGQQFTAYIQAGPTGAPKMILPYTAIRPRGGLQWNGIIILEQASHGLIISASSASALDITIYGTVVVG